MGKKIDNANVMNIDEAVKQLAGKKICIVTGVTGQDGSYMVDYLLENTDLYIVGGVRRLSVYNHTNIRHINNERFILLNFDLTDSHSISRIIEKLQPEYFINLAAQSFVASSWDFARQTWATNSTSVLDILEAIRLYKPDCRMYQAGSSEEFGNVSYVPQDEKHPLKPRSPYGASKAAARQLIKVYRDSYGLYAVQGWLFNHESERRGVEFVTRKITTNTARIKKEIETGEKITPIELGNIDAKRDWSHAEDFVEGIWKMLNQDANHLLNTAEYEGDASILQPENLSKYIKEYVLSSNETHTVREFVEKAFSAAGIVGHWSHLNLDNTDKTPESEVFRKDTGEILVKINPKFYRPAEVDLLFGDSSLARKELNWNPKNSFEDLVKKMVSNDIKNTI
jgi:GDPmannose 4,6-dehydratase